MVFMFNVKLSHVKAAINSEKQKHNETREKKMCIKYNI